MVWTNDRGCLGLCLSLCALAVRGDASQDAELRAELVRLSQRRIFLGRQSVGVNLLEGVREIAVRLGRMSALDDASRVDHL
jgi:hypothetical protein